MKKQPVKRGEILEIYVDGAARGNPGPAAWAFIYTRNKEIIHQKGEFIGDATNNTAEYLAIINALRGAGNYLRWDIKVYSDSKLAINQINKNWRINYPHLSDLCNEVYNLCDIYNNVNFYHIGRNNAFIQKCDKICNDILDSKGFKKKKKRRN